MKSYVLQQRGCLVKFVAVSRRISTRYDTDDFIPITMPHNLTAGGCMAEVAMTTLTWTFVGGGELISYIILVFYILLLP